VRTRVDELRRSGECSVARVMVRCIDASVEPPAVLEWTRLAALRPQAQEIVVEPKVWTRAG
jgi:hypothetical protein